MLFVVLCDVVFDVLCGVWAWHGMTWHGMAWHDLVWFGMLCYAMPCYAISITTATNYI